MHPSRAGVPELSSSPQGSLPATSSGNESRGSAETRGGGKLTSEEAGGIGDPVQPEPGFREPPAGPESSPATGRDTAIRLASVTVAHRPFQSFTQQSRNAAELSRAQPEACYWSR
eukprot:3358522-Rhodomonas_salina.2